MTRGGGDEDIEGGRALRKFLDTRKGAPNICMLQNQKEVGGGGILKN